MVDTVVTSTDVPAEKIEPVVDATETNIGNGHPLDLAAPPVKAAEEGQDKVDAKDADVKDDAEGKTKVPEEYKEFSIPEGMEFDKERAGKFVEVAKEAGLDQENAQKFVDFYSAAVKETAEAQAKMWAETQTEWVNEAKADKEYGGQKFEENIAHAKKALEKFGTPELGELADDYGMGNHPEFIRFLYRVGKAMSEDSFVAGGATSTPRDAASILYPEMN